MRCDVCGKPASVHEIMINNGEKSEVHLCLEHAIEAGLSIPSAQPIAQLLASQGKRRQRPPVMLCAHCGLSLADFKKSSRLGCAHCYDALGEALEAAIIATQGGATAHHGESPAHASVDEAHRLTRARLVRELEAAVTAEQYERAARLRDQLADLAEARPAVGEPSSGTGGASESTS
ncbi:MAG: UvrB/UvrC motif-containing protein [Planctomycetota bacterium]|nr:UvrB/UvrC motif-containing protein [Planctomycetota bacterium]MDA1106413.1 UvrB/UvrC motif-containing protein [Planctomycetota bacterium]